MVNEVQSKIILIINFYRVRFYAFLSEWLPPSKSPLCIRTYPPIFHYGKTWGPLNVYRAVPRVTFDLRTKSLTTQEKYNQK